MPVPQTLTLAPWSDAEIAYAAKRWSRDGFTARQIAAELCRKFGTGRSEAVVLRLAARMRDRFPARGEGHKSLSRVGDRLGKSRAFVERPTPAAAAAYDAASLKLELTEVSDRHCHFPTHSNGAAHQFCGAVAQPGKPYCEHHAIRAYGDGLVIADLEASQGEKTACPA